MRRVRIGTRGSALALCQAQTVQRRLQARHADCEWVLEPVVTDADRRAEASLAALAGEGIFVKELEAALLAGRIDLAVHSLKDLPLESPAGLWLVAVLERDDPRDAVITRSGERLEALAQGAQVGTSSPRRRSQLLRHRPDVVLCDIRGNVDTRLRKLDAGAYEAIVLAACGLDRLGLSARITQHLEPGVMLPEPGQGAVAVEGRRNDPAAELAVALNHAVTRAAVEAERAFLRALGGGCRVPIAAYGTSRQGQMQLEGAVTSLDGRRQVRGRLTGPVGAPEDVGSRLAKRLVADGALELLRRTG